MRVALDFTGCSVPDVTRPVGVPHWPPQPSPTSQHAAAATALDDEAELRLGGAWLTEQDDTCSDVACEGEVAQSDEHSQLDAVDSGDQDA
jgi:hypothetical protein